MSFPLPEGSPQVGARSGAPRRLLLAPGTWRVILGVLFCLPGGLLLVAAALLLAPGVLLADSGLTRLAKYLVGKQPPQPQIPALQDPRNPRSSMTWPAPTPRQYQ